ncbi:MAG: GNAT family N-acetyltransferase [Eubacteriales bacterium]|nr:GNAT family N-acetyltransferase [Eubacteriales bacterium]
MPILQYQPLDMQHLHDVQRLWTDPAVIQYTGAPEPCTAEQAKHKLNQLRQPDVFAVFEQDRFIGIVGCPCINKQTLEFGLFYQFIPAVWGQGCATTAVQWLLNRMKQTYGNPILYADVIPQNKASEAILMHFGFTCHAESAPVHPSGDPLIVRHYKLTAQANTATCAHTSEMETET